MDLTPRRGTRRKAVFIVRRRQTIKNSFCETIFYAHVRTMCACQLSTALLAVIVEEVSALDYISVQQAAKQWGISDRRVRALCEQGKIPGVVCKGRSYLIPAGAVKPADGRRTRYKEIPSQYAPLFARIDGLKEQLDQHHPLTVGELRRLRDEFMVEYTYNSNAIEGNTLTLQETALVLEGVTIDKKPLKDHLEAVGHRDAFLYVQNLVRDKAAFSESIIKQIHTLVLMDRPEDRGSYRHIPVRIMGAYREPSDPVLIPELMEKLAAEFDNKKLHPIESAALFHLKFAGIHPFVDGNGRTGRLILNLFLMQNGYPPVNVKFADRKRYYDSFDHYYRDSDAVPLVEMIAEYIEERLKKHLSYISRSS
jgi:excisionase family DNA binding protein